MQGGPGEHTGGAELQNKGVTWIGGWHLLVAISCKFALQWLEVAEEEKEKIAFSGYGRKPKGDVELMGPGPRTDRIYIDR